MSKTFDVQIGNSYNISKLLAKIFKYLEDNTILYEKMQVILDNNNTIELTKLNNKITISVAPELLNAINTEFDNINSKIEEIEQDISNIISATIDNVSSLIEGSDNIIVELNPTNDKIIIELDQTFINTLATQTDIEQLESEIEALQNKQNKIVSSEEIIIDNETNELMLNNTLSNKINKSLVTPTTTPISTELVGIDTSNSQARIKIGDGLNVENDTLNIKGMPYLTTAPTSNNTSNTLISVVLSSEPSTYYNGYLYYITG